MMSPNRIRELLHEYRDNGISAIPVYKTRNGNGFTGKVTRIKGWQVFSDRLPTEKEIDAWNLKDASGVAVVLGPISNLACVDIDRNDALALTAMQWSECRVVGKKGEKRFFRQRYSESDPFPHGTIITHNKMEFFLRSKYAVVNGLHSQGDNTDPIEYEELGEKLVDIDLDGLTVIDMKYIEVAKNLGTTNEPIAPKQGEAPDGRFNDMASKAGYLASKNTPFEEAVQILLDHDDERNKFNLFFLDKRWHKGASKKINAMVYYSNHLQSFSQGKLPSQIEEPTLNTYSRLIDGQDWGKPIPFSVESQVKDIDPELIPVGAWKEWIHAEARNLGCDIAPVFLQSLTVLSSLLGTKVSIFPKKKDLNWTVHPILWTLHVGRSGSKKSPITDRMMKILKTLQCEHDETFKKDRAEKKRLTNRLKVRLKEAKNVLKRHIVEDIPHEIEAGETLIEQIETELAEINSKRRQYVIDQITPEKLFQVLEENPHGSLMYRDEFSSLWKTFRKSGYESFRAFLLSCADGRGASYQTKNMGENFLVDACLALHGNIQPSLLEGMIRETIEDCADDGFLQRAILTAETDADREVIDAEIDQEIKGQALNKFHQAENLEPCSVTLSTPAYAVFMKYLEHIDERIKGLDDFMGSFVGKFRGRIITLSYLIEFIKSGKNVVTKISRESLICAGEILEYSYKSLANQRKRPVYSLARLAIDCFKLRTIETDSTMTDLQRQHCRFFRSDYTKDLITLLEKHNYIKIVKIGKGKYLKINPHILDE